MDGVGRVAAATRAHRVFPLTNKIEPLSALGLSFFGRAKVAELVDARDLGSRGLVPWGFESPLSHFAMP